MSAGALPRKLFSVAVRKRFENRKRSIDEVHIQNACPAANGVRLTAFTSAKTAHSHDLAGEKPVFLTAPTAAEWLVGAEAIGRIGFVWAVWSAPKVSSQVVLSARIA